MKASKFWSTILVVFSSALSHASEGGVAEWTDSIEWSGDLRLRYEAIRQTGAADRKRSRFRGRFAMSADVSDEVNVVFGLATGGDNPVSNNQTFGDGFTSKDIGLNLLYIGWKVTDQLNVTAGKVKQPWHRAGKTSLVWDSDLNPEGAALGYKNHRFFASGGAFLVEERSTNKNTMLYYGQGGLTINLDTESVLTAGAGYFEFTNTIGAEPLYRAQAKGNSVDVNGNYVNDYRDVELFLQYDRKFPDWPLTLFAEWVRNTEVSSGDTAYSIGAKIGKAKKQGSMQFGYAYHDTGADAVVGTFSDSDFAGGFTDSKGHLIKGKYALREKLFLGFTVILSEYGESSGNRINYDRLMLDFEVKF